MKSYETFALCDKIPETDEKEGFEGTMLVTGIMFLTIVFLPRLIVLAANKVPFFNALGSVFLCFFIGLLLSFGFKAAGANLALASDFSSVLVCLAMPLILFSADLPALKKLARPMLISFGINCAAAVAVATGAFFLLRSFVPAAHSISAMLAGSYIGGTPNMIAIGKSLGSGNSQILLLQTADMLGGEPIFCCCFPSCPASARRLLPKYSPVGIAVCR